MTKKRMQKTKGVIIVNKAIKFNNLKVALEY